MKELPTYKLIHLTDWSELHQPSFQSELNNKKNPIILDVKKLNITDQEQLFFLESKILIFISSPMAPYPIYFLGVPWNGKRITSFMHKELLPSFFPHRGRGANKLHQQLLIYNQLLQYQFEYLNFDETQFILQQYRDLQSKLILEYQSIGANNQLLQLLKQQKK